jgi:hypothetical protein
MPDAARSSEAVVAYQGLPALPLVYRLQPGQQQTLSARERATAGALLKLQPSFGTALLSRARAFFGLTKVPVSEAMVHTTALLDKERCAEALNAATHSWAVLQPS